MLPYPKEEDGFRLNSLDGSWEGTSFPLSDGSDLEFYKGMQLIFHVSAPGYEDAHVSAVLRKKKQKIKVKMTEE